MAHMAVNAAFGSRFPVYVRDFELYEPKSRGTYLLLDRLNKLFGHEYDFYFVIGTDLIAGLKNWSSPGVANAGLWLIENAKFIVVPRPGTDFDNSLISNKPNFTFLKPLPGCSLVSQELSSTEIRKRLGQGSYGVDGLTQPIILAHIIRNHLYE
jgi:nicotinic acid mononucleotide adenylyltransferase